MTNKTDEETLEQTCERWDQNIQGQFERHLDTKIKRQYLFEYHSPSLTNHPGSLSLL